MNKRDYIENIARILGDYFNLSVGNILAIEKKLENKSIEELKRAYNDLKGIMNNDSRIC